MTFSVLIEPCNGEFAATLAGAPSIRVVRSTRAEAVEAIRAELQQRVTTGELLPLEMPSQGVSGLAGAFREDPTLRRICEEAYRLRDADRPE